MWPPTAVLQHHEQQQRVAHHERAIAARQDEEQEIFHGVAALEATHEARILLRHQSVPFRTRRCDHVGMAELRVSMEAQLTR